MGTEVKGTNEQWKSQNQETRLRDALVSVKGPVYPAVLATPQFGKSKSIPDLGSHSESLQFSVASTYETLNNSKASQLRSSASAERVAPRSPVQVANVNNPRNIHLTASTPLLSQIRPRSPPLPPPNRHLPPIPSVSSPKSPIVFSSRSSASPGSNCFGTPSAYTAMSPELPLATSTSTTHKAARSSLGRNVDYTSRNLDIKTVDMQNRTAADDEMRQLKSKFVRADVTKRHFSVDNGIKTNAQWDLKAALTVGPPPRRSLAHARRPSSAHAPNTVQPRSSPVNPPRPNTANAPRASTLNAPQSSSAPNSTEFQGRSQRRKSFVGQSLQSFQNFRKSISKSRSSKSPADLTLTSFPVAMHSQFDASQLPPSPSLPSRFNVSPSRSPSLLLSGAGPSPPQSPQSAGEAY